MNPTHWAEHVQPDPFSALVTLRRRMYTRFGVSNHLNFSNVLPEEDKLVEVTSNFWGTKFEMTSMNLDILPSSLGTIVYKASLLHLQPRQMRLELPDMLDNFDDPFGLEDDSMEDLAHVDDSSDDDEEGSLGQGNLENRYYLVLCVDNGEDSLPGSSTLHEPLARLSPHT